MTDKKRGRGQPPHEPTQQQRKMVESMSAYGIPQEDISKVVGINRTTLAKHYREELDTATAKACAKVAETLYRQATDVKNPRSATAAIFWLKTRGGWRETVVVDNTSSDGTMSPAGPAQEAALAAMRRKHRDAE
jgi:DNA-binding XRE family transcriptional regulator